jgi:hypothetical protein
MRIITVMNSNDPVARALTLRTLGRDVSVLVAIDGLIDLID